MSRINAMQDRLANFRETVSDHGSVQLMMLYTALSDEWRPFPDLIRESKLHRSAMSRNMKKLEALGIAESSLTDDLRYKQARRVQCQSS